MHSSIFGCHIDLKFYIKLERFYIGIVSSEAVENDLLQHISTYLFKKYIYIYIYHGLWAYTFIM